MARRTVKPDPGRRNYDECIAHLLVRPQPIVHLPCSEVVAREAVVAEDAWESLHVGEDLPIHGQPQGVGVVEGDDANGQADSPRDNVVAGQGDAAVGDQRHDPERGQEKDPGPRHGFGGVRDFQVSCDYRRFEVSKVTGNWMLQMGVPLETACGHRYVAGEEQQRKGGRGERAKLKEQEREKMPAPCSERLSSQPETDWPLVAQKLLLFLRASSRRRRAVPLAHAR